MLLSHVVTYTKSIGNNTNIVVLIAVARWIQNNSKE